MTEGEGPWPPRVVRDLLDRRDRRLYRRYDLSVVYFLAAGGLVKIGTSRQPRQRIAELRRVNACRLDVLAIIDGDIEDERWLHSVFATDRHHAEWFCRSAALDDTVRLLARERRLTAPIVSVLDLLEVDGGTVSPLVDSGAPGEPQRGGGAR